MQKANKKKIEMKEAILKMVCKSYILQDIFERLTLSDISFIKINTAHKYMGLNK